MQKAVVNTSKFLFALSCISIGLYPIIYFVIDRHFGLLSSKSPELLSYLIWNGAFYGHIVLGGIALLIGWTQFSSRLRSKRMDLHRTIGKIYFIMVLISGICSIYLAYYATGGIMSQLGFGSLGIIWISTSIMAMRAIKARDIKRHENFMILSYAACFAAVTLRIWLPLLIAWTGDFIPAYRIVAWLCWVPNIIAALFLIRRKNA